MGDNTDHYNGVLLEDINHKLDAILEGEDSLAAIGRQLRSNSERLTNLEDTVYITIKTALKDHDQLLHDHKLQLIEHNRLMDDHKQQLAEHNRLMDRLTEGHKQQQQEHEQFVKDHAQEMREHRAWFDNHEWRLLQLEAPAR